MTVSGTFFALVLLLLVCVVMLSGTCMLVWFVVVRPMVLRLVIPRLEVDWVKCNKCIVTTAVAASVSAVAGVIVGATSVTI